MLYARWSGFRSHTAYRIPAYRFERPRNSIHHPIDIAATGERYASRVVDVVVRGSSAVSNRPAQSAELLIRARAPPAVAITSPADGAVFSRTETI